MVDLKTAEHVAHFMKQNISLSRFDERFITNILSLSQVTTNQVELFYKIIFKYRRQFVKHELDVDKLLYLPWSVKVVESSPHYTTGHVTIENNKIYFRSPYNKNFLNLFRKQANNHFVWDRDTKQYEATYSLYQLKLLLNVSSKFYTNMFYCDTTKAILDELKKYEGAKYWQPTLSRVNGNLYILASNSYLDEALKDLVLNTDGITIATLVQYGVTIDKSVYDINDKKQRFMANLVVEIEISDVSDITPWLQEIGCDAVYFYNYRFTKTSVNPIRGIITELQKTNIDIILEDTIVKKKYNFPVVIKNKIGNLDQAHTNKFGKYIKLVDSTPVEIK